MKRFYPALLAAVLLLTLPGCQGFPAPKARRCEATYLDLFDTVTSVVGYRSDPAAFSDEAGAVHDQLFIYHRLYDVYNDYEGLNNLKTVNDSAGIAPVKVDRKIIDLLLEAKRMYALTDGRVNVAFGSVLFLWHTYREAGLDDPDRAALPPMAVLAQANRHTDIGDVVIDEAASTVYLADPELRLDVGAIAKGFAAEQVGRALEEGGTASLLLSVGGNIRAVGSQDGAGTPWKVGVQDPEGGAQDYLWTLGLTDTSLVTSGSYQRFYTVDGVRYHHIIDPDTLMPADYFASVTICTPDSGDADALSTAVFNLPFEDGLALIRSLEDTQALWVFPDGTVRATEGFPTNLTP